ncbi:hypothetical protein D5R93_01150 [Actinomyces lilanjuaniae]|uniref:Uncharacterized protein n=1 Tax=Actinomyces lilanjuaniae TaxID=2321394 RepID=A0ABN5PLI6_9ACTO|nr:hypothetical protein D5R93_01150 [Actinomyces lilanjuaniae]
MAQRVRPWGALRPRALPQGVLRRSSSGRRPDGPARSGGPPGPREREPGARGGRRPRPGGPGTSGTPRAPQAPGTRTSPAGRAEGSPQPQTPPAWPGLGPCRLTGKAAGSPGRSAEGRSCPCRPCLAGRCWATAGGAPSPGWGSSDSRARRRTAVSSRAASPVGGW